MQEIRSEINKLLLLVLLALFCAIGIPALIYAIVPNYAKKVTATYFLILFGSGAFRAYREGDKSRAKILAVPFGIVLLSFFGLVGNRQQHRCRLYVITIFHDPQ